MTLQRRSVKKMRRRSHSPAGACVAFGPGSPPLGRLGLLTNSSPTYVRGTAGPSTPLDSQGARPLETLGLRTIQTPDRAAGLLESYAKQVLGVPTPARRLKRIDELPPHLRRHVGIGPGKHYGWFAWISGEQMSLLTGALALERSQERGRPVLEIRSYTVNGVLEETSSWVRSSLDHWTRCE